MKKPLNHLVLQGFYHPMVNQGIKLSLAVSILLLISHFLDSDQYTLFAVISLLPVMFARLDQPCPHFFLRLLKILLLFVSTSFLVLALAHLDIPTPLIFFPLTFCFAMFAIWGTQSGRLGTGAMLAATFSLLWLEQDPFWIFPLFFGIGILWFGLFSMIWTLWQGHRILRNNIAQMFVEIAEYYALKAKNFHRQPSQDDLTLLFKQQEKFHTLLTNCKSYLNRYGEQRYNGELKELEQNFLFAIDLMELLQSNQHKTTKIREIIQNQEVTPWFDDFTHEIIASLKYKSFAIKTHRQIDMSVNRSLTGLQQAILHKTIKNRTLVYSLKIHFRMIQNLLHTQAPAFQRSLSLPASPGTLLDVLTPHLNIFSPILRYSLRLSVTVIAGLLLADLLNLSKSYWTILAIIFVMQSGYLATRTLIGQRIVGTIGGVGAGLLFISYCPSQWVLIVLVIFTGLFAFSMIFHNRTLAILGVTTLLVIGYQAVIGNGEEIILPRLIDTLLGCSLAFISNILLWPQFHGSGIRRDLLATLTAYKNIMLTWTHSLSDPTIPSEHLTRKRRQLFTAQNNLLASYQQMLREPYHTQSHIDSLDQLIFHFNVLSSHINALLAFSRNNEPLPADLGPHLEKVISGMFSCWYSDQLYHETLSHELTTAARQLIRLRHHDDSRHQAPVLRLLDLIYRQLDTILSLVHYCDPHSGETSDS